MAGDDPYQAQWNLKPRIEALRAEAKSLRRDNNENYRTKETELAVTRDRLAREQYGIEQSAKSADIQVTVENREVERIRTGLEAREAAAASAGRRGDTAKAREDQEDIAAWRAEPETHVARARQAQLDAAELREQAAGIERRRTEINVERDDLSKQAGSVESEIDKMEQQADILQRARLKYAEADLAGDDVPRRATLELEAEALVTRAGAIEVNRDVIRVVVPELPETTPGLDDDPGPLPEGADEVSATELPELGEDLIADGTTGEVAPIDDITGDYITSDAATGANQPVADDVTTAGSPNSDAAGEPEPTLEPVAEYTSYGDSTEYDTASTEAQVTFDQSFASDPIGGTEDAYASNNFETPVDADVGYVAETDEPETFDA